MIDSTRIKLRAVQSAGALILLLLPLAGNAAVPTTRERTISPVAVPPGTPPICPSNVPLYKVHGYSVWQWGPGEDAGRKFDLMPAGYSGAAHAARLLSFFSMSDIHITDKESPAQVPYVGWSASFGVAGPGGLNQSAYSPIILSTTHVLDAAVRTVNALHKRTPFDFGIVLGDVCNASQFNELRWFIDVMDGKLITPSSGARLGADSIGYQKPYQAAGLDRSIPWYEVIGNHDQFWMGIGYPTAKIKQALVGSNVLNVSAGNVLAPSASEGSGMYVGVVDGTTRYGDVIKGGPTNLYATPPTVAADPRRHSLTADVAAPKDFIGEFFNSTSSPQGHGFNRANSGSLTACYSFEPLKNLPLKVVVLDDTCKSFSANNGGAMYYGGGWMDAARMSWLTNELQMGQDAGQLMIVATHIPVVPQAGLFNSAPQPQFYDYRTETNLLATLHRYPNIILLMAGHRHMNTVTPQPSTDPAHPEYGFWEVETPSLRDFPQQFRAWEIVRNSDNTISIVTTDVDPEVEDGSPTADSRGYDIGVTRIFGNLALTDTTSHAYNAELVKPLSPAMQKKIAGLGATAAQ